MVEPSKVQMRYNSISSYRNKNRNVEYFYQDNGQFACQANFRSRLVEQNLLLQLKRASQNQQNCQVGGEMLSNSYKYSLAKFANFIYIFLLRKKNVIISELKSSQKCQLAPKRKVFLKILCLPNNMSFLVHLTRKLFIFYSPNLLPTQDLVYPTFFSLVPPPAINNDRQVTKL